MLIKVQSLVRKLMLLDPQTAKVISIVRMAKSFRALSIKISKAQKTQIS